MLRINPEKTFVIEQESMAVCTAIAESKLIPEDYRALRRFHLQ